MRLALNRGDRSFKTGHSPYLPGVIIEKMIKITEKDNNDFVHLVSRPIPIRLPILSGDTFLPGVLLEERIKITEKDNNDIFHLVCRPISIRLPILSGDGVTVTHFSTRQCEASIRLF